MTKFYILQGRGNKRKRSAVFLWLLVFLGVGVLGWIFWNQPDLAAESSVLGSNFNPRIVITLPPPPRPQVVQARVSQPETNQVAPQSPVQLAPIPVQTNRVPTNTIVKTPVATNADSGERFLKVQLALVRRGISPGCLDGVLGGQTEAAIRAFQRSQGCLVTGQLDTATLDRLALGGVTFTNYVIRSEDLQYLQPLGTTWLAKSQQDRLHYETILEALAEMSQSSEKLVRKLNPNLIWSDVGAGTTVKLPWPEFPPVLKKAAFIRISLSERTLQAFDENTILLAHFPCSIGQRVEKRPVGELHVAVIALKPNYTFDPEIFSESPEARQLGRKLILHPGPNNPVGTVWIGLDKPGYGIHGTPRPEQVGRTESHGCFRLANWNAEYLAKMLWVSMPVLVEL